MNDPRKTRDFFDKAKKRFTDAPNEVPLHRSYGVKKRVSVFTHINHLLAPVIAVFMLIFFGIILIVGFCSLIIMLGHIGIALVVLSVLAFGYFVGLRVVRKRIRFIIKLKMRCKSLGYKVTFTRGFFKGLCRNKQGIDLTVDTGKICYCVRYFTTANFFTHLTFVDSETLAIKTNITRSHFKFILGFNNPRTRTVKYSFNEKFNIYNRKAKKVLLLNPVPHDCFKKDVDGATIPIGTGETIGDYTVHSGSSFINTLARHSMEL